MDAIVCVYVCEGKNPLTPAACPKREEVKRIVFEAKKINLILMRPNVG